MSKERGGPGIRQQTLVYPMTEARLATGSCERNKDEIILTLRDAKAFMDYYFGPDADRRDFRASPLLAPDHAGLPPAFIVAAGHDPLHDDAIMYAEKLHAAEVPVTLRDYPRMCHGFFTFPHMGIDAKPALAEIVVDLRERLPA
ncbi:MAG: alpha/beta hydrolase fold domain-containing protein [Coriobacteriia bacterium]|nr:alpha/beta hydrolase fold domain-containing protein [Coriobacteriia bacterium]